jgi:phenylalanine-4-hydroxylase
MSFRVGGAQGLRKSIESKNTCTAVYSSGLQVSGTFTDVLLSTDNRPYFIKTSGSTSLAVNNKQMRGHGKEYHQDGFSSPIGRLREYSTPLENFTFSELKNIGIEKGKNVILVFESGITVSGEVEKISSTEGKIQLISFKNCTVKDRNENLLFDPSWGNYDMAVGEKIVSVFCGAADKEAYEEIVYKSGTGTYRPQYDDKTLELHHLYHQVRNCRQNHTNYDFLENVWHQLKQSHQDDWLCALEILEILDHEEIEPVMALEINNYLEHKSATEPELRKLIRDGFYLIKHPVEQKLVSM